MDANLIHSGTLGLDHLALGSSPPPDHDKPRSLSFEQEQLTLAEARRLGLNAKFMKQLQQQRFQNEDEIIAALSQEKQALEVTNPIHKQKEKFQVTSTTPHAPVATWAQDERAERFDATAKSSQQSLDGAAPSFVPSRNRNRPPKNAHKKIYPQDTVPSYRALPVAPLGTRWRQTLPSQRAPENVSTSYQAISTSPMGTRTLPPSQPFTTKAIDVGRPPHRQHGLLSNGQQARHSTAQLDPEKARYNLRSSDQQIKPTRFRARKGVPVNHYRSPEPTPAPDREQSPRPPPIPAPQYLLQAEFNPKTLPVPQRLLLVLDLNGTLICRDGHKIKVSRLNLKPFLYYCLENHSVLIWSSARPANVKSICSRIFTPRQRHQLLGEWARDTLDLTQSEYCEKTQVYKRLERIWDDQTLQAAHPDHASAGRWSQANTLLLDDSLAKAAAQPYNLIEIPEFTKEKKLEPDYLGQVVAWLEEARRWSDVSAFCKRERFRVDVGWLWDWSEGRRITLGELESKVGDKPKNQNILSKDLGEVVSGQSDEDGGVQLLSDDQNRRSFTAVNA